MNKTVDVRKNTILLLIINIIILVATIFFKTLYTKQGYFSLLVNVVFVINLIILTLGIVFNIMFVRKPDKYDNKKYTIMIIIIFVAYLLLNSAFMMFANKGLSSGYTEIGSTLSSYCKEFECDKYETITSGNVEKFVIEKKYYDYEGVQNEIKITTTYNTKKVLLIEAEIYSQKELFSQNLIKNNLDYYFKKFDYEIKEDLIKEAFEKWSDSSIKDNNATYKVTKIYKGNDLNKLKTTITLDLTQG